MMEILFWTTIIISTVCDYIIWGYLHPWIFVIITCVIWTAWYFIYYMDIDD